MIKNYLLRFAVPFHFSNSNEINKKESQKLEDVGWIKESMVKGENDLYDHIAKLTDSDNMNAIASSWSLKVNLYDKINFISHIADENVLWKLNHVGMLLYTTEVGILWYEIAIQKMAEIEILLDFAYSVKELARGRDRGHYMQFSVPVQGEEDKAYREITEDSRYEITEKKNTPQGLILKGRKSISLYEDILEAYLSPLCIDTFFANRQNHQNKLVPDRGIAFSWCLNGCDSTAHIGKEQELKADNEMTVQKDEKDIVFHMGRNYKSSYEMATKNQDSDFFQPFEDSVWYCSLEGCANYTYPSVDKKFYSNGYRTRLNTYYYLYLLCLGQYYSLLQLSQEVAGLPTDEKRYSSDDNILEKLLDKIHVFKLKNNFSQVGHLTQHNEYYEYVQRRLGVAKMQQELEIELQSLYEMVASKQEARNASRYRIITIISAVFVVVQTFVNVASMHESYLAANWEQFWFSCVGMILAVAAGFLIWLLVAVIGKINRKHEKKHKI